MNTQHRNMIKGLVYKPIGCPALSRFFERIDELGGWPVGYKYVGFQHTIERCAGFTNSSRNDGWWTVVASADDYYFWKISDKGKQKIADRILRSARITTVDVNKIFKPGTEL